MTQKQLDFIVSFHTRLDRQGPGSDAETFVALDLFQPFLDALEQKVNHPHVRTLQGSMDDLPFEKERFDLVWSEGAIYNMGFEQGVKYVHPFLKKHGIIALSEITWLTNERPAEIESYWNREYPEIDTAQGKIMTLHRSGYQLVDHFILFEESWLDNDYNPLEKELMGLQGNHLIDEELREVIQSYQHEIELYHKFKEYYGYGFYIARKVNDSTLGSNLE
jgi:hypothetical protein